MNRVLTIGTFDLFHVGHLELFSQCRALARYDGEVIVGVNSDDFVASYKRPAVVRERDRLAIVKACRLVTTAFLHMGRGSVRSDLNIYLPDIIAVGDDWRDRDYLAQLGVEQDWLDARGIRVVYLPRTTGESTTALRERLAAR